MANGLYAHGKEFILNGGIDLDTDTIRALLVDTALYAVNLSTDNFLSDIAAGARLANVALTGKLVETNGSAARFDADDATFVGGITSSAEAIVLYKDTGVVGTSRLIAYWDTGLTGFPIPITTADILLRWSSGADRIFSWNG